MTVSLADLRAYARFAAGLPRFLRTSLSVEEAVAIVRDRLTSRGERLLDMFRRPIFGHPASPYRGLCAAAGVELADIEQLIRNHGVEGALTELRRAGVYVTFEEFKGRQPIVRHGREIPTGPRAFDNPFVHRYVHGRTSGSTGAAARTALDLDHMLASMPAQLIAMQANGVRDVPSAVWRTILPGIAGISNVLRGNVRGRPVERWFSPIARDEVRPSRKDLLATNFILLAGRLSGRPLPRPEIVPLDEAGVVVDWVVDALAHEGRCIVQGHVSCLLRVALAALDRGADLTGAVLWGGGEPPTDAKVAPIRATGARYVPTYYLAEAGAIGLACADPVDHTDTHFMADALALIQHPVQVPGTDMEVEAFCLTSLLPTAPKVLVNVESDDFGIVEERRCSCLFGTLDLHRHIRRVRSYRKLTGEGMSLVGSDAVRVLEEVLPGRFGGTPFDFQLVQEEDERGFTRLALLVHPRLSIGDEAAVADAFLEELGRSDDGAELARAVWFQAGTLTVRRAAPEFNAQGKFYPLRTVHPTVVAGRSGAGR